MSLLGGAVGQDTRERRLLVAAIYAILILGGITMIYPFLVMVSGSFKSDVDIRTYDIVPRYFFDDRVLFRKYMESRYNESVAVYNTSARQEEFSFMHVDPPEKVGATAVRDFRLFRERASLPATWSVLGDSTSVGGRMLPANGRGFRRWLAQGCGDSIAEYNRRYGTMARSWLAVIHPNMSPADRLFKPGNYPVQGAALEYKRTRPPREQVLVSLDGAFVEAFLKLKYGGKIADYNRTHGTRLSSWADTRLLARAPAGGLARRDWLEFVRNDLSLQFIVVDKAARGEFAAFLDRRYGGSLRTLSERYGKRYTSFAAVPYPSELLTAGTPLVDWEQFVREVDAARLSVNGPEQAWRGFLRTLYGRKLADLNRAHGSAWRSFDEVPMPTKETDWTEMKERSGAIRREFATRNYRHVVEYLALHGRGLWNTFVFCLISILAVLIVNPVAAYAMSRFNLPSTYKVLLFLLATMAFPPMVTAIPSFLMLKEFGMLNTFWALVLPGIVNGYAIFLLKGFFDSQPRELYEAAQLDGANEWVMFWHLTIKLSTPILAVIALGAFNAAYGAFMFAFIVCQDEAMWTLMVWLYQLQQYSHQSVTFAALLIASVPTLLVFLLAQRFILRGIVIPVEK
jgi:ABC-type glycerol-3-phosphate transport system permease component